MVELAITPLSQPDGAHAALADGLQEPIRPDFAADERGSTWRRPGAVEQERTGFDERVLVEPCSNRHRRRGLAPPKRLEPVGPGFDWQIQHVIEQPTDQLPRVE